MSPEDPVAKHFRLVPAQATALRKLGIVTIRDLLYHFPARYEAQGTESSTRELVPGAKVTLYGTLSKLKAKKLWKSRRAVTEGWLEDATGRVKCMWFNQPYIASYVSEGSFVRLAGTVGGNVTSPYIANPEFEVVPRGSVPAGLFEKARSSSAEGGSASGGKLGSQNSVIPVYPESRGVTSLWFYHAVKRAFSARGGSAPGGENVLSQMKDPIPKDIRTKYHLPDLSTSLVYMHTPEKKEHAESARKRFAFEEIFIMQTVRAQERALNDSQTPFRISGDSHVEKFLESISFPPTRAQSRAIADILNDFSGARPMARLLEGDVGSGKTLVAAAIAYAVVHNRPVGRESGTLQVAYMAPTEILATQHFQSFIEYFNHLPIKIALITGSGCWKFPSKVTRGKPTAISRAQLLKWVENGEIAMVVGTHALIQKSVKFQNLALAIVDEQHRFGVNQRKALIRRTDAEVIPHFLSMTATPIPRTLALTLYGDLDISVLDELPPGRAKVTTRIIKKENRDEAYESVRRELADGRQAFVVCPRIEEPDPEMMNALQAKSAKAEAKHLQKDVFPEFKVGLLHGAMAQKEKDSCMQEFVSGKIQVLVATSVVEVGINVPNATVMLIEGAERFGLAQLHQLRGRIMRSSHPPHCFLLPETFGQVSSKRLRALEKSDDGFKLAETDLETRGAGDLLGRRQWGISDIGMEALKNPRLIQAAREEAFAIVREDRGLEKHPELAARSASVSKALHSE